MPEAARVGKAAPNSMGAGRPAWSLHLQPQHPEAHASYPRCERRCFPPLPIQYLIVYAFVMSIYILFILQHMKEKCSLCGKQDGEICRMIQQYPRHETTVPKRYLLTHAYHSTAPNSQDMESTTVSIRRKDKENVV